MIIVGAFHGMSGACCATTTGHIRTIACRNKHHQTAAGWKTVAAYTELKGVQPRIDGEEKSNPPFFLRQESHALDLFCIVDMAVAIKDFFWAADASAHQMDTFDLVVSHHSFPCYFTSQCPPAACDDWDVVFS